MIDVKKGFQFHDILFFLLLVFSFYFTRNTICSLLMVLFFGYTILRQMMKIQKPFIPYYCVGVLAFVMYGALNVVANNVIDADVAQTMTVSLMRNLLMTYTIIQYIVMQNDINKVLRLTEASILFTALIVVGLSMGTITSGRLAEGTEMNANKLSMLCVYGFIITLYLVKIKNITFVSGFARSVFYLFSILLTGSRKGLIMTVLAVIIVNLAGKKSKIIKSIVIGFILLVMLYFLIMNVDFLYNIIGERVENLIKLLFEGRTNEGSLNSRRKFIEIGMEYIKQKPWTGYGLDCFKMISGHNAGGKVGRGGMGIYSHNNYIELLFGAGIIGLILYYLPVLSLLKKTGGLLKKNICISYLLAILISKLAIEYAYVSYCERVDAYILAVIVGCIVLVQKEQKALQE